MDDGGRAELERRVEERLGAAWARGIEEQGGEPWRPWLAVAREALAMCERVATLCDLCGQDEIACRTCLDCGVVYCNECAEDHDDDCIRLSESDGPGSGP